MNMNRRDAFKALAAVAGAAGLTVQPVTTQDAKGVELVILKCKGIISMDGAVRLKQHWLQAVHGTALEHTRAVVLGEDIDVEIVRTR